MASWKNKDPNEVPEAGDFADWRADVMNEGYWTMNQLGTAVGTQVNGRTWAEIFSDLNTYLKNLS